MSVRTHLYAPGGGDGPRPLVNLKERLNQVSHWSAAASIAVGLIVMCGWIFDIPSLRALFPGLPEMKFNTAFAFILSGLSLWLLKDSHNRFVIVAKVAALIVLVVGLATLGEYAFGWDLGIDRLAVQDRTGDTPFPGRISLLGAINFVLLGASLALLDWRRKDKVRPSQWLALTVAASAFISILGYAYNVSSLYRPGVSGPVALQTTILFLLLGIGVIFARPSRGFMTRITNTNAPGYMVRRLLPATILVPPLVGWFRLQGEYAGLYDTETGLAIFATANVFIFSALIWYTAGNVQRAEAERELAERKTAAQLERLALLNRITRAIGERHNIESIFQVVVRSIEDQLPADYVSIYLYDAVARSFVVAHVGAKSLPLAKSLSLTEKTKVEIEGNGLAEAVKGSLLFEPDIAAIDFPFPQRLSRAGLRSLVIAPLANEKGVFGVLLCARREAHALSSTDCEFLKQVSGHVALAASHAQLHESLQAAYDDLHRTQRAIMQQERLRALGQMASGIAHDINNAILPIVLYTDTLLENEAGLTEETRKYLETVQRVVGDVSATIGRMREFYREHPATAELAPVDLNEIATQTIDLTRARWAAMALRQGITIAVKADLAPGLPRILGADHEIREALTNLIFNAVDALPTGGTISVRTSYDVESGQARLAVTDNGVGMDEMTRLRCLEPFFTTKGEQGTGLGLAMVYGIAQRHSADLNIVSQPGAGTTITLGFRPTTASTKSPAAVQGVKPPNPMRLLIVDDDPFVLDSMRAVLELDGHAVTEANGGKEGIEAFRESVRSNMPFDVVITDLGMPYVDGNEVSRTIKKMSPATHVILLSGWGQRMKTGTEFMAHADSYLEKPPKLEDLREALASAASRSNTFERAAARGS